MRGAAVVALAALALAAAVVPAEAKFFVSELGSEPSGVELRFEYDAEDFLGREDERRCVKEKRRNKGYRFVPVQEGESGVTFTQCEIGKRSGVGWGGESGVGWGYVRCG